MKEKDSERFKVMEQDSSDIPAVRDQAEIAGPSPEENVQDRVVRLAPPQKKGLLRIIFSRLLIFILLIVAQIFLYLLPVLWMQQYMPYYALFQALFVAVMVLYLFNNSMDFTAKLTWMALIAVAPLGGTIMLFYTKTNMGHRNEQKKTQELIDQSRSLVSQDPGVIAGLKGGNNGFESENNELRAGVNGLKNGDSAVKCGTEITGAPAFADPYGTEEMVRYLSRSGSFPVFNRTRVSYYSIGEDAFAAMLEELEKAEKFIFLEFFIIEEGYMWGRILDILTRKVREGLDVRVMYDGMCEISTLPFNYTELLEKEGIRAKSFSPIRPLISTHYNYRDHRKIMVIDGKVAFTGGVNLADEYINRITRFGHWKDTAIRLTGDAVSSLTLIFLQMWNLTEKEADFDPGLLVPVPCEGHAAPDDPGYVIPFGDCPLDEDKVGESIYIDILYRAMSYVHIMTPYLILDGELETALKYAAQRGVDVKLILPGIPDKTAPYALAKSHYKSLTSAGVKIYEYTPGFVHAKVFVSDACRAVVGTINLDYRSLYHHFECAAYLYRVPCIREIEEDFQKTLASCREVTPETIKNEKLSYRIGGVLMKVFAPLM